MVQITQMEDQKDSESHYEALRNEVLNYDELIYHWNGCSKTRLLYIKNNSTADIFDRYPSFKESYGYKLVSSFKYFLVNTILFSNSKILYFNLSS